MYVSSTYQLRPTLPRRRRRRFSANAGVSLVSQSRTTSWLKTMPRIRNISGRSRRVQSNRDRGANADRTYEFGQRGLVVVVEIGPVHRHQDVPALADLVRPQRAKLSHTSMP